MIKRLVTVLFMPVFLLHAEDFVINLDQEVKEDYKIVEVKKEVKEKVLEEKLDFYKKDKNSDISLQKEKLKVKKTVSEKSPRVHVDTENKKISELLSIIGKSEGNVYILRNKDFLIKEGYKIYNTKDLIKLVRLVSNFEMVLQKTDIENTYFVDLKLKEDVKTLSIEAKVDLEGLKTLLMNEYGIKLYIGKDLAKNKTKMHLFGTYTVVELIEDLQNQLDIWFDLRGKKIFLAKTKEVLFDIKRDGEFSIDFTKQSSASTGAEEDGTESSTGFTFKMEDYSAEKFLATLKENFPKVVFKKSYSGFVMTDVTPMQYKNITNYFKNVEARHELISGEIVLLNFQTNDGFKYDMNWSEFLVKMDLLKVGKSGTLFIDGISSTMSNVEEEALGASVSLNRMTQGGNVRPMGIMQALSEIGEVSIVDKWTIAAATGVPTGFTNYQKVPYYTIENTDMAGSGVSSTTADADPVNAATVSNMSLLPNTYKLRYALTGFKSTFRVNKTKTNGYVIDGAVDYSGIIGWTEDKNGSRAPEISGKSMRIYSELKELDKTIVIGGFKNLTRQDNAATTPLLSNLPILGWLFKSEKNIENESEFILLIKLKSPTIMGDKNVNGSFKQMEDIDTIRERAYKEKVNVLSKW